MPGRDRVVGTAVVIAVVAIGFAVAAGTAGATDHTAAAKPKVCREAGISDALVKKVFGPTGTIAGKGVSQSGRCALQSGVHGKPPSGCDTDDPTCLNTDVILRPLSEYKVTRSGEIAALNTYGHAHVTKFSGAGTGAELLTSTKGYGGAANPLVLFKAGRHTVIIEGPFAGDGQTTAVYKKWEKLARAINAKIG